jgi:hypothetical protein
MSRAQSTRPGELLGAPDSLALLQDTVSFARTRGHAHALRSRPLAIRHGLNGIDPIVVSRDFHLPEICEQESAQCGSPSHFLRA